MNNNTIPSQDAVRKVIENTLSKLFDNTHIQEIILKGDIDSDGDRVLKVDVIFSGSLKHSDVEKMTGAVRLLRPKLNEIHESAFPILSFISQSDYY